MNPVIRRRLPPSVRRLLTDIGPKEEEWADAETDTDAVCRDGILLPSRETAKDELLFPAKIQENTTPDTRSAMCMLCKCKPSNYTCPRCNFHYCGISCYQSPEHSVCSEEFYKESVLQELKEMGKTEVEGRKKMQEILLGLRQKADISKEGMQGVLKEAGLFGQNSEEGEGEEMEKVKVLELLSGLAELQQSGQGSVEEAEVLLKELQEIGGATGEETECEKEEPDLAERLTGLDIDKLSEEELWDLLSQKEQDTFMGLLKDGTLCELVPLWQPWWEEHEEEGKELVKILDNEINKADSGNLSIPSKNEGEKLEVQKSGLSTPNGIKTEKKNGIKNRKGSSNVQKIPPISAKIPKLASLCANPSSLVCYSLVNALYGYAFSMSLFNGDSDSLMIEFCDMTLALSDALSSNKVFNSIPEALDSGESLILREGYLDKEDSKAPARAVEAVAHILTGPNRRDGSVYCLAALSHLRSTMSKARTNLSKDDMDKTKRQKYFLASKKCEFFQAWVLDNTPHIHRLAMDLWREHGRRESSRDNMERAKTLVGDSLKKLKRKENCNLIEELS